MYLWILGFGCFQLDFFSKIFHKFSFWEKQQTSNETFHTINLHHSYVKRPNFKIKLVLNPKNKLEFRKNVFFCLLPYFFSSSGSRFILFLYCLRRFKKCLSIFLGFETSFILFTYEWCTFMMWNVSFDVCCIIQQKFWKFFY